MNRLLNHPKIKLCLAWLLIVVAYVTVRVPYLDVPLNRDEGLYAYVGRLMLRGAVLYRDVPDYNAPLVFALNAVMMLFISPTPRAIHLAFHAYNFVTMVFLFYFSSLYFKSRRTGLWCALAFALYTASPAVFGFAATAETLTLLPIVLGLLTAFMGIARKDSKYIFLSGFLAASACWSKQQAGPSALAVLIYVAFERYRQWKADEVSLKSLISDITLWIAGALCISAAIGIYFYSRGALGDLIYWTLLHGSLYAKYAFRAPTAAMLYESGERVLSQNGVLSAAVVGSMLMGLWRKNKELLSPALLLTISFLGVIPGFAYPHYFMLLAPGFALSAGIFLDKFVEKSITRTSIVLGLILFSLFRAHGEYFEMSPDQINLRWFRGNMFAESPMVADFIASNTTPDDPIFIFGSEPQILLLADRKSASSFLTTHTLFTSFPKHKEFQDRMWRDVQRNRPAYIVFVNLYLSHAWDYIADHEIIHLIEDLIRKEYTLAASFPIDGGAPIYDYPHHIYIYKRKLTSHH